MSEFYIVRHGQASFGADNYDKLSPLGHQQSDWLGEYFAARNLEFSQLWLGEMVRHKETASGICRGLNTQLETVTHTGLNEFDFQNIILLSTLTMRCKKVRRLRIFTGYLKRPWVPGQMNNLIPAC